MPIEYMFCFIYSLEEHEKCLLSICFALFVANNALKSFRRAKSVACLVLYSRKLFLITLPYISRIGWGNLTPHILSIA